MQFNVCSDSEPLFFLDFCPTDNFNSTPFHSTPKSLSYPTLLPRHSSPEPSPLHPATPNKDLPLTGGSRYGSEDRNGLALKKSSSPSNISSLLSPQRMQSSPGAFLQSSLSSKVRCLVLTYRKTSTPWKPLNCIGTCKKIPRNPDKNFALQFS